MSRLGQSIRLAAMICGVVLLLAPPADAQVGKFLKQVTKNAVKRETAREINERVAKAFRCVFDDPDCFQQAQARGEDVVFVDENGNVINDANGQPVMNPNDLPPQYQQKANSAPSSASTPSPPGVITSTYDFEPGERMILDENYSEDVLGDFPRNLTLVKGSWDLVEIDGMRMLRNSGPRHSAVKVPLPETLPEQFTIEIPVLLYGQTRLAISISPPVDAPKRDPRLFHSDFNYFDVGSWGAGIVSNDGNDVTVEEMEARTAVIAAGSAHYGTASAPVPIRIMADGNHVKMYVGEHRVANVPNADLRRSDTLWLENTYHASAEKPILIGPIRVAAGGRDLYDALSADGRVAIHDILFDTDQATIKPESTNTLNQIQQMLQQHSDLSLMIEGHTDSSGEFDHNMELSRQRAASVKEWLVSHGTDSERLRTMGLGSTQPKASNESEEGRRQNRRVELVKIG
jgi:OOP family OmpA-OmpF porin